MANTFGTDILIQSEDPKRAASFYVKELGFEVTAETPELISLHGPHINLFIERGPLLGPVLEVFVQDVGKARAKLVLAGCHVVKDEPEFSPVLPEGPLRPHLQPQPKGVRQSPFCVTPRWRAT
jgi:hypothetical protein